MALAFKRRMEIHQSPLITFVCDTNPNYTNVCSTKCSFCAFCKDPDEKAAFTLSPEQLAIQVFETQKKGATTVLLQGGHNKKVRLTDWVNYIKAIRELCPTIHIHPFSPSEIIDMAKKEAISTKEVLKSLINEGIRTIPGGGAEILTDSVRSQLSPEKCTSSQWLQLMEEAHSLGIKTTATMMFGHIETDEDIIEHLMKLRDVQEKTGGFTSFIPWSFKPGYSKLTTTCPKRAHPLKYIRIIAVARLMLHNFSNIQSSWFSESERAGALALLGGANDLGGILLEENVLAETGYIKSTTVEKLVALIEGAGFKAARRNSDYEVIEKY
jgi:cyclic dehypoxanthinyl futalosine synthase